MTDSAMETRLGRIDAPQGTLLRRYVLEWVTVLYLLTVVYNSCMPFNFTSSGLAGAASSGGVAGLALGDFSLPDVVSNIFFYLPLGVLLPAVLVKRGWSRVTAGWAAVLFAIEVSYVMESAQRFLPTRVSSTYDVFYNGFGALSGAACSRALVRWGRYWLRVRAQALRNRPSLALCISLGFGLVVLALLPFDVTFSVDRLREAFSSAELVPFHKLSMPAPAASLAHSFASFSAWREWWMLVLDYGAWSLWYAVLALTVCYYLRRHCDRGPLSASIHAWGLCAVYAFAGSVAQVFIISRGFDATVPLMQMGGAVAGTLLQGVVFRSLCPHLDHRSRTAPGRPPAVIPWVAAGLGLVAAGIVLRELAPFRFTASGEVLSHQWAGFDWVPLGAYQANRLPVAVADISHKLLRFMCFGALWAVWGRLRHPHRRSFSPWRWGAWAAAATALLEGLQLFLPSRVPSLTDVLLAWGGTAAGAYTARLVGEWWRDVRRTVVEAETTPIDYRVELGLPDAPEAPRETVPTVEPRQQ